MRVKIKYVFYYNTRFLDVIKPVNNENGIKPNFYTYHLCYSIASMKLNHQNLPFFVLGFGREIYRSVGTVS